MAGEGKWKGVAGDESSTSAAVASAPSPNQKPALQVIVLGSQGGPLESNVTAFLVRSISSGWRKGSVMAVDAGVHLGAITRILEDTQPPDLGETNELTLPYVLQSGPFAGMTVHSASAKTNAAKIHADLVDTYLITHPHLDHISAFVINTAGLSGPRRKKLAGLPGTIQALKTHIFNNIIWPNLSDEDHGAGLFTYLRLNEGGSPAMGNVDGYLEFNEGLAVKVWSVSHGHNIEKHASHRGSGSNTRLNSVDASSGLMGFGTGVLSPRSVAHHNTSPSMAALYHQQPHLMPHDRAGSGIPGVVSMGGGRGPGSMSHMGGGPGPTEYACVYDSSSYFIRDVETGVEVLIFGDVEGDSVSMNPRNLRIWQEAAPKIVTGKLKAILIECSYDDSRPVDRMFGHLAPSFLIQEMANLAEEVKAARVRITMDKERKEADPRRDSRRGSKRKREGMTHEDATISVRRQASRALARHSSDSVNEPVSPKTMKMARSDSGQRSVSVESPHITTPTAELSLTDLQGRTTSIPGGTSAPNMNAAGMDTRRIDGPQLEGLKVVIIHVKDKMEDDERVEDIILDELHEHESFMDVPLGCEWIISEVGQSLEV
ncbi:hypothetical protein DHEL01_v210500 [Diaporthe helianthi]|uniref:cAMP phosphodiesterase class-II n=1 Tax=Diaporthe helianthi TaxID=158607 RepID=A0A2P5HLG7_DIAHE|nr:hypothetical protein DHEL01_v210500 [Diaporthe helianthi]